MAFPTTGVLDNTTRANENPLSDGGQWASSTNGANAGAGLQLLTDRITGSLTGETSSYWNTAFGPDMEVWIGSIGSNPVNTTYNQLVGRLTSPGATYNAYVALFAEEYPGFGTGNLQLYRVVGGAATLIGNSADTFVAGDAIGMDIIGTTIRVYKNNAVVLTVVDGTISGTGFIGLLTSGFTQWSFATFGGGTVSGTPFDPSTGAAAWFMEAQQTLPPGGPPRMVASGTVATTRLP